MTGMVEIMGHHMVTFEFVGIIKEKSLVQPLPFQTPRA
jgi:hypothetical protein